MCHTLQVATDRVQKEYNLLNEKVQKLHHDLEEQIHTNTQLLAENSQKVVELKQKDAEIDQIKVGQGAEAWASLAARQQRIKLSALDFHAAPRLLRFDCVAHKAFKCAWSCAGQPLTHCWLHACKECKHNKKYAAAWDAALESCSRVAALRTSSESVC